MTVGADVPKFRSSRTMSKEERGKMKKKGLNLEEKYPVKYASDLWVTPLLEKCSAAECADKFLISEQVYVEKGLHVLSEVFLKRLVVSAELGEAVLDPLSIRIIFMNVSDILNCNLQLVRELTALRLDGSKALLEGMGEVMNSLIPFFKLYATYIKGYRGALKKLEEQRRTNEKFANFVQLNEYILGYSLSSLMCYPVTRMSQYLAYIGVIFNKFPDVHIHKSLLGFKKVTDDISHSMKDRHARDAVVQLQEVVFRQSCNIVSPSRFLVKSGDLKRIQSSFRKKRFKDWHFFLFNDMIIYGLHDHNGEKEGRIRFAMRLEGTVLTDEPDGKDYYNAFKITNTLHGKEMLLSAQTQREKFKWMRALKTWIVKSYALHQGDKIISSEDWEAEIYNKKQRKIPKMVPRPFPSPEQRQALEQVLMERRSSSRGSLQEFQSQQKRSSSSNNTVVGLQLENSVLKMSLDLGTMLTNMSTICVFDDYYQNVFYANPYTGASSWQQPKGATHKKTNVIVYAPADPPSDNGQYIDASELPPVPDLSTLPPAPLPPLPQMDLHSLCSAGGTPSLDSPTSTTFTSASINSDSFSDYSEPPSPKLLSSFPPSIPSPHLDHTHATNCGSGIGPHIPPPPPLCLSAVVTRKPKPLPPLAPHLISPTKTKKGPPPLPTQASPPLSMPPENDFLSQIRCGRKLKTVSAEESKPKEVSYADSGGLNVALAKSMARYRKFVQADNDDNEGDDDNDDDDDWD